MSNKTRAVLNSDADSTLADNTDGDISPADVRASIKNLADSALIQEAFAALASAATTDIGAESSSFINITGTATITSFGTVPSGTVLKWVKFAGALILTHNATTLILPTGANITTEAQDLALMHGAGSNWRCILYFRSTGKALVGPAAAAITDAGATGISVLQAATVAAIQTILGYPTTSNDNFATRMDGASGGLQESGIYIDDSGNLFAGKTSASLASDGAELMANGAVRFIANATNALVVNRRTSDGVIVAIMQDGTIEGTITVSGTTVSLVGSTGAHWSQFHDGLERDVLLGTVLEAIDELCSWPGESNKQSLPRVKICDTVKSRCVHGLFMTWDPNEIEEFEDRVFVEPEFVEVEQDHFEIEDGVAKRSKRVVRHPRLVTIPAVDEQGAPIYENPQAKAADRVQKRVTVPLVRKVTRRVSSGRVIRENPTGDMLVAASGDFFVRIAPNEKVELGDLLESAGGGCARAQRDDMIRSTTIGKVTGRTPIERYSDGSYIVPCVIYSG